MTTLGVVCLGIGEPAAIMESREVREIYLGIDI